MKMRTPTIREPYQPGRLVLRTEVTHSRNTYGCEGAVLVFWALRDDILGGEGFRPNPVDLRSVKGELTSKSM